MKFNIPEIEQILTSVSEDTSTNDWEYDRGRCWESWYKKFFKLEGEKKRLDKNLSLIEYMDKGKEFNKTNASEEDFKKFYPDFKYKQYKSPWDFNYRIVSIEKIQKIAFELQQYIPLEYNKLCSLIKTVLRRRKRHEWNFDTLSTQLMSYDKDLYLKTRFFLQMKQQNLVA